MQPVYLALGDSMSIDAYAGGPGRGAASLLPHNRDDVFPGWAAQDLRTRGYAIRHLAQDGATTGTVLDGQIPRIRERPDLVTLSMGGNDLMGAYGDTAAARETPAGVATRADRILDTLRAIAGPAATLIVTTVYDPTDGTGRLPGPTSRRGRTHRPCWPTSTAP